MSDFPEEAEKLIQSLREKELVEYEGKWDVKLKVPDYGIKGEKFEIKTTEKVNYLQLVISQGMKWEIPNRIWNRDGDYELHGVPIFNIIKNDVDKIECELKDGRWQNGEFINNLPLGEYLVEARAHTREAGEEVTVKKIIQVVEDKKDFKKVKPKKEEKVKFEITKPVKEAKIKSPKIQKVDVESNTSYEDDSEQW